MKIIAFVVSLALNLMGVTVFAQDHSQQDHTQQDHSQHASHNMVLYGGPGAFYASHLVYKEPHNYQVILQVNFDLATEAKIADEMKAYPKDQFIFLLDHMDISQIQKMPSLSGQISRNASDDSKQILFESVRLEPQDYSVIYFSELPLSLEKRKSSGWEEFKPEPFENCRQVKCY